MKKYLLLTLLILLLPINTVYAATIPLSGEGAALIDFDTGEFLYEKNSHVKLYPASTTKMVTAILAVENSELTELVTIDQEVVSLTYGSHIALEPGEILTMEQLLHALLLPSANDAALAIAKHVGGSVENFARMMNQKAAEIGAVDSNFVNPNGLHDDRHVSSAHDLALIGRYAMNNETIKNIVDKVTYEIPPTNKKDEPRYLRITNKLLHSNEMIDVNGKLVQIKYEGASGVKTGYTSNAANCLVSYAERDGQKFISAVVKAESNNAVYSDTHKLLNYGFENYISKVFKTENEFIGNIPIVDGEVPFIAGVMDRNITLSAPKDNTLDVEERITIDENLVAPITKGQIMGQVEYLVGGEIINGGNILSTDNVNIDPMTVPHIRILSNWYWFVFGFLFLVRLFNLQRKKIKRKRARRRIKRSY